MTPPRKKQDERGHNKQMFEVLAEAISTFLPDRATLLALLREPIDKQPGPWHLLNFQRIQTAAARRIRSWKDTVYMQVTGDLHSRNHMGLYRQVGEPQSGHVFLLRLPGLQASSQRMRTIDNWCPPEMMTAEAPYVARHELAQLPACSGEHVVDAIRNASLLICIGRL